MICALLIHEEQVCHGVMLKYLVKDGDTIMAVAAKKGVQPMLLSSLGDRVEVFGRVVCVSRTIR